MPLVISLFYELELSLHYWIKLFFAPGTQSGETPYMAFQKGRERYNNVSFSRRKLKY